MPKKRYKALFLLLTTILTAGIVVSGDDADVMAKLAKSLTPSPPSSWSGSNFCKWQGINCDSSNKVTSINLSSKSLSGTLPSEINQLSGLKSLSLQRNQFTGPLPVLSDLGSLEEVSLDENSFDSIPTGFLSGLTSLQSFSMNNNAKLPPWTIPDSLKDSTSLTSFYASKANIMGQIPDIFESLPNFQNLKLSYNNLTGRLPPSFSNSRIQNLYLNNQGMGLSGPITVLGNMSSLQVVWLHSNHLSGPIPDLSSCTDLSDIQLRDNSLTGPIPDSFSKLPNLKSVALQNNRFQGPVPSFGQGVQVNLGNSNSFCLSKPGPCDSRVTILLQIASTMNYPLTLAESWEGNDPCQTWQSITCDKGNVVVVNFAKQNWSGTISPAFANLTNLKTLLLNDNRLEGPIPNTLTTLKQLQTLDISNNNISGKVPAFPSSVSVKTTGNSFIGKDVPLSPPPGSRTAPGAPSRSQAGGGTGEGGSKKSTVSPWVIIVLVAVAISVVSVLGLLIYRRYTNKKNKKYKFVKKVSSSVSGSNSSGSCMINHLNHYQEDWQGKIHVSPPTSGTINSNYLAHDGGNIAIPIGILKESTCNFNENNIIGKGGFGVVYRGQLQDRTRIAVKRMETSMITDKGLGEFKAEIEVLTKVRHRHLVALLGFCDNGSERLLVYEYMPQGCLGQHLFQWREMGVLPLSWNQRVVIALDVARGVEYLHSLAQQSFIHRDLKPSNILLGDDTRAKVSDFGLVRSAPDGNCSIETRLAGTFGYLAPEYAATGRVTTKVDVYAFGVILMEIITGRKAIDDSLPDEQSHLVTWFRRFLQDKEAAKGAVDPAISSSMDEETFNNTWKVAELAGHCTARESYQRPDMSHAVNVLSALVDQWRPVPVEEDSFEMEEQMSLPQVLRNWKENDTSSSIVSTSYYNESNSDCWTKSSKSNSNGNRPL